MQYLIFPSKYLNSLNIIVNLDTQSIRTHKYLYYYQRYRNYFSEHVFLSNLVDENRKRNYLNMSVVIGRII